MNYKDLIGHIIYDIRDTLNTDFFAIKTDKGYYKLYKDNNLLNMLRIIEISEDEFNKFPAFIISTTFNKEDEIYGGK